MPARKIVNDSEVEAWIREGKTYDWMAREYLRKYNIEIKPSAFGNFRRKKGLDRRTTRHDELLPWTIRREDQHAWPPTMLRAESRLRDGKPLSEKTAHHLEVWKQGLREKGLVVHYDPELEEGWFYVEARPGIDTDLIRVPDKPKPAEED